MGSARQQAHTLRAPGGEWPKSHGHAAPLRSLRLQSGASIDGSLHSIASVPAWHIAMFEDFRTLRVDSPRESEEVPVGRPSPFRVTTSKGFFSSLFSDRGGSIVYSDSAQLVSRMVQSASGVLDTRRDPNRSFFFVRSEKSVQGPGNQTC